MKLTVCKIMQKVVLKTGVHSNNMTITAPTKPAFATLTDNGDGTGTISFSPGYSNSGTYTVTATDGAASDSESFDIIVNNVNRPPVLNDVTDTEITIDAGASQIINLTATDPDSDDISYSIVNQNNPPSFVTLQDNDDGTASVIIAPGSDETSTTHFVTIRVTDNGNPSLYDEVAFTVIVSANITCGMDITSGNNISFGTINPGNTSPEQTLQIQNTGNTEGMLSVFGSDWMSGTDSKMSVDTTKYATSSGFSYDTKSQLEITSSNIGAILPDETFDIFLQLKADLTDSLFSGELTQDIEVNITC